MFFLHFNQACQIIRTCLKSGVPVKLSDFFQCFLKLTKNRNNTPTHLCLRAGAEFGQAEPTKVEMTSHEARILIGDPLVDMRFPKVRGVPQERNHSTTCLQGCIKERNGGLVDCHAPSELAGSTGLVGRGFGMGDGDGLGTGICHVCQQK